MVVNLSFVSEVSVLSAMIFYTFITFNYQEKISFDYLLIYVYKYLRRMSRAQFKKLVVQNV